MSGGDGRQAVSERQTTGIDIEAKKKSKAQIKTNIMGGYPGSLKEVKDSISSPQHELRNKVRVRSGVTD